MLCSVEPLQTQASASTNNPGVLERMFLRVQRGSMQLHHALHGRVCLLRMALGTQGTRKQIKRSRVFRIHLYRLPQQAHGR